MDSSGGGASIGRLVDNPGSRGAGTGGLVGGCTVVSGGRGCGRDRGGWGGVAETGIRSGCRGGLVVLAGGWLVTGWRGAVAGRRLVGESWIGKDGKWRGGLGVAAGAVAVGVVGRSVRVTRWVRGGGGSGEVGGSVCWSGRGERG
ncbi:hypothetical protein [Nocardia pneumoniae]|uniref:hypothetical protein n=1 Tax=Nocardia pneumoniae TaxID=228601 RepID=UPI000300EAEA|nr:hypothetical protein [Nocardia pneumoniae]